MVEQQQQSKGADLLSSRRNAHCCIWCIWGVRGALRGVGVTCLIMLCVSTSFARFLSSCRCVGISFLCHQTSCAPTSQKSQSSPLKSLCPSHFCFNHHQRPSQRAIFARALRPAILVCSDGAPTWWIEEASARGRRTHTLGHREAHYWRLQRIMSRQALSSIWRARQRGLHFFQYYANVVYSRIQDSSLPPLLCSAGRRQRPSWLPASRYHTAWGCSNAEVYLSLPEADRLCLAP